MLVRNMVRLLINDADSTKYTDDILTYYMDLAIQMTPITEYSQLFTYSYTNCAEIITPTPDEPEKRLIALQCAYIIESIESAKDVDSGIRFSDAGNTIDTTGRFKNRTESANMKEIIIRKMIMELDYIDDLVIE